MNAFAAQFGRFCAAREKQAKLGMARKLLGGVGLLGGTGYLGANLMHDRGSKFDTSPAGDKYKWNAEVHKTLTSPLRGEIDRAMQMGDYGRAAALGERMQSGNLDNLGALVGDDRLPEVQKRLQEAAGNTPRSSWLRRTFVPWGAEHRPVHDIKTHASRMQAFQTEQQKRYNTLMGSTATDSEIAKLQAMQAQAMTQADHDNIGLAIKQLQASREAALKGSPIESPQAAAIREQMQSLGIPFQPFSLPKPPAPAPELARRPYYPMTAGTSGRTPYDFGGRSPWDDVLGNNEPLVR